MKNFIYLLLLFPLTILAQINVDNQWKNFINPVFQNLDKTKIQSGILLDYGMDFTNVPAYNGVLTDSTYIDANVLGDIYKTLFMSKVVADTLKTPLFDKYAYNWSKERFKATKDSSSVYVLSGLLYEYQKFNINALSQNKIIVTNNKYYDKYSNGVWQNPYDTGKTFAITTPLQHSRNKKVYFKLPNNLLLSNIKTQIASIQINADNGLGYINFPVNTTVALQFFENKVHTITYKITLTNNQVLYCRSKFKVDDPTIDTDVQKSSIAINDERVYVYEDGNFFNAAWLTIRRIPGNTQITRPFIIAEGLDTGNFTAPEDFGGERTMGDFLGDINTFADAGNLSNLIFGNNQQYDIIYIDWVRGMADMRSNSKVLEEVIKWVNAQKVGTQPNVLLGQSMGGVIGRYTLARMEKENKTHNVRLFIAHDSPMQGANTPLAFQHFAIHMKSEYASTPILYGFGEVLIPIGAGLGQLGSSFLNIFGANTSVPTYVSPSQLLSLQDQTASRQLNYWSALSDQSQTRSYNQSWQQTLTDMGWPLLSRNIAISNGNECSANNGFAPGAPFFVIDSRSKPSIWLDALNSFIAPLVGIITNDIGLYLVGSLPGGSRWQTNFDFNSYGVQGSKNLIYRGRIRFEKKLLWIGPTIIVNLLNKSCNAPNDALPFDTYSGGRINFRKANGELAFNVPILSDLVNVVNNFYGFIPVVSALDIKRNNSQVIPIDYLKKYAGGAVVEPGLTTKFKNFIVDYNSDFTNNQHISFQVRNGNWLADELEVNAVSPVYPNANCTMLCADNAITGSKYLCSTGNYSVTSEATTVSWSITSGTEFATITSVSANTATLTAANTNGGYITLQVNYGNDRCGSSTATATIWVGKPKLNTTTIAGGNDNVPVGSYSVFTVNAASGVESYDWSIVPVYSSCIDANGLSTGTLPYLVTNGTLSRKVMWGNCTGEYIVRCIATNSCGKTYYSDRVVRVFSSTQPNDPCVNSGKIIITPNPSIKYGTITVNIAQQPDVPPCNNPSYRTIRELSIYDLDSRLFYNASYRDEAEVIINEARLERGYYVMIVITGENEVLRENFLVED